MFAESEHGHSHGHGTGVKWLDLIVGVSAFFISIVSLVVSIEHGKTMEKMVQQNEKMVEASTLPFLTFMGSNIDPVTNLPRLRLTLRNGGVGPAVIDWFEVRYKGTPYGSVAELLRACCAEALAKNSNMKGLVYSNISQTILPSRDTVDFISVSEEAGKEVFQAVERARQDISLQACFCSVLDECWLTEFKDSRPRKVKECKAPAGAALW